MNLDELDYEKLPHIKPYPGDLVFKLDGMTEDEYIAKVTEEINAICLDSVPFDKWDMLVTFMLATLEVAGDFFIGSPSFVLSLSKCNGPFVKWLNQFHEKLDHSGSPLDFQGKVFNADGIPVGSFGGGDHRGRTLGHDLPLARALFGAKVKEDDTSTTKAIKKTYNASLMARDLIQFTLSLYSICNGKFIDFVYSKDGEFVKIITSTNQNGTEYSQCNVFVGLMRYLVHMLADFCSSKSLPIPGWSLLSHFPDRDVEAFALKLYKNGMNLRSIAMQSIPVAVTELLMAVYIWLRSTYSKEDYSDDAWERKKDKLLLIAHGITSAVNIGKVIITKSPWLLNPPVIIRTFLLTCKVIAEEASFTNEHIKKVDLGVLKARIETAKTLILLDKVTYETENVQRLLDSLDLRIKETNQKVDDALGDLDKDFNNTINEIGE